MAEYWFNDCHDITEKFLMQCLMLNNSSSFLRGQKHHTIMEPFENNLTKGIKYPDF